MPRKKTSTVGHTGRTSTGNTRDLKVERIGPITVYKRGNTYYLYYREGGQTQRSKVDGNLAVARATAHKVANALAERRPSPIAYTRTTPSQMVEAYLNAVATVQKLALRTRDRYKAALDRFLDFCGDANVSAIDSFDLNRVEDFVRWLRGQRRNRNGSKKGSRDFYKVGGIKFVLSTCRTAFNWAARRRMLPPFSENPFGEFGVDTLKDAGEPAQEAKVFSPTQEATFFAACSPWQKAIFATLATYGMRLGELTHLLVEDVDFVEGVLHIRSKPWLFWTVKTRRQRQLPLLPPTRALFEKAIAGRKAGFVFLNEEYAAGTARPEVRFSSPPAFQAKVVQVVADLLAASPAAGEKEQKRSVVAFCRTLGQIPEKRVRNEFLKLTELIGCPDFTRVHDLRHLFSSRAQEQGMNPLLVQQMLGHTNLKMTARYTHLGMDTKREALGRMDLGNRF